MEVRIHPEAIYKIKTWVNNCDIEVSGMGTVEFIENVAYVTDVFLVKQKCTGAETEMCADALADLEYQVIKSKCRGTLNFWWHSHVDMGVFWSNTDMNAIHQMGKHGFILSTVFNRGDQIRTSFYQGHNGFLPEVWVDQIKTSIGRPDGDDKTNALLKELAEKVEKKVWKPKKPVANSMPRSYKVGDATQQALPVDIKGKPILTGQVDDTPPEDLDFDADTSFAPEGFVPVWVFGSNIIPEKDGVEVYEDFEFQMGHICPDLQSLELYYRDWWRPENTYETQ